MTADISIHVRHLRSPDVERRVEAAEALCALGEAAGDCALELIHALADADERVCEAANAALEGIGAPPLSLAGELAQRLNDANSQRGFWAATLLGRMGHDAAETASALGDAVANESVSVEVRQKAAWALARIGPAARCAVPQLQKAKANNDTRLAQLAGDAIRMIVG